VKTKCNKVREVFKDLLPVSFEKELCKEIRSEAINEVTTAVALEIREQKINEFSQMPLAELEEFIAENSEQCGSSYDEPKAALQKRFTAAICNSTILLDSIYDEAKSNIAIAVDTDTYEKMKSEISKAIKSTMEAELTAQITQDFYKDKLEALSQMSLEEIRELLANSPEQYKEEMELAQYKLAKKFVKIICASQSLLDDIYQRAEESIKKELMTIISKNDYDTIQAEVRQQCLEGLAEELVAENIEDLRDELAEYIYSKTFGLASLDESVYKKVYTKLYMDACRDLCDKIKYKGIDIKTGNIEM